MWQNACWNSSFRIQKNFKIVAAVVCYIAGGLEDGFGFPSWIWTQFWSSLLIEFAVFRHEMFIGMWILKRVRTAGCKFCIENYKCNHNRKSFESCDSHPISRKWSNFQWWWSKLIRRSPHFKIQIPHQIMFDRAGGSSFNLWSNGTA